MALTKDINRKSSIRNFSFWSCMVQNWSKSFYYLEALLSIEWNSIRLGGPAHGIVIKTVHKTLPGVVGGPGGGWV